MAEGCGRAARAQGSRRPLELPSARSAGPSKPSRRRGLSSQPPRGGGNGRAAVYRLKVGAPATGGNPGVGAPATGSKKVGTPSGGVATSEIRPPEEGAESWCTSWTGSNSGVGTPPGRVPKRTSKEVLYNGASLGEAPIPGTPGGGALDAPPACYPKPRVLHPVNAMGAMP